MLKRSVFFSRKLRVIRDYIIYVLHINKSVYLHFFTFTFCSETRYSHVDNIKRKLKFDGVLTTLSKQC